MRTHGLRLDRGILDTNALFVLKLGFGLTATKAVVLLSSNENETKRI